MTQTQTTAERIDALINNGVLCECEGVPPGGPMHGVWKVAATIAAEIDALTADNAQANQWLVNGVAKIERLEKERDEARAEVERLRPAADLGDAYLASINEDADDNDIADLQDALEAAAARARAAKERKP
jgi:uncharacterized coiled-coil DUF342 family protein